MGWAGVLCGQRASVFLPEGPGKSPPDRSEFRREAAGPFYPRTERSAAGVPTSLLQARGWGVGRKGAPGSERREGRRQGESGGQGWWAKDKAPIR